MPLSCLQSRESERVREWEEPRLLDSTMQQISAESRTKRNARMLATGSTHSAIVKMHLRNETTSLGSSLNDSRFPRNVTQKRAALCRLYLHFPSRTNIYLRSMISVLIARGEPTEDVRFRGHLPGDDRSRREKIPEGRIGSGAAIAFGSIRPWLTRKLWFGL